MKNLMPCSCRAACRFLGLFVVFMGFLVSNPSLCHAPEPGTLTAPSFSHSSGFYRDSFELHLHTSEPDARIYYTLNSSTPSVINGLPYELPIRISSQFDNPYRISLIPALFDYSTIPEFICESGLWIVPQQDIFKAVVVKARVINQYGEYSPVVTRTFFVDPDIFERYTLPVVSLSTDESNLFDPETGLYIPANSHHRGREWEKPGFLEFFEKGGKPGFAANIGMRIHGGAVSRYFRQKSFRIYFRREYDQIRRIKYELFPGHIKPGNSQIHDTFSRIILRNSGTDWTTTMFRDALIHRLSEGLNIETQASRTVIAFLNGEYWGIYNIRERYDARYFRNAYGIDPEKLDYVQAYYSNFDALEGQNCSYIRLVEFLRHSDMTLPDNYKQAGNMMDMDNFITVYAVNIYLNNTDWPHNNHYAWRLRTETCVDDAPYGHDGRWRWLLKDLDFGLGSAGYGDAASDTLGYLRNNDCPGAIFTTLMKNEAFRISMVNRLADLMNTVFKPKVVQKHINEFKNKLAPEMEEQIRRWGNIPSLSEWRNNITHMQIFSRIRPANMYRLINWHFNLEGTYRLSLEKGSGNGHIQVNSVDIHAHTPGVDNPDFWTGRYFRDVPVNLAAVPAEGYVFSHWISDSEHLFSCASYRNNPIISVKANENTTIIAHFVKKEQP